MSRSDIVQATRPLIQLLNQQAIGYYIGGSVASSAHGLSRTVIKNCFLFLSPIKMVYRFDCLKPTNLPYRPQNVYETLENKTFPTPPP